MPRLDYANFLPALAAWMATAAGLQYTNTPRAVWVGVAVEADAADPYSVLKIYGGSVPFVPQAEFSVQVKTTGESPAAAMAQSALLFGTMLDTSGVPLRMQTIQPSTIGQGNLVIPGVRVNAFDPQQPPSVIGLDDRRRTEIVFNLKVRAVPI